jgi:hypothetical protein
MFEIMQNTLKVPPSQRKHLQIVLPNIFFSKWISDQNKTKQNPNTKINNLGLK